MPAPSSSWFVDYRIPRRGLFLTLRFRMRGIRACPGSLPAGHVSLPRSNIGPLQCVLKLKLSSWREVVMARGDKSSYSDKQKRMAHHVEESEEKRGKSKEVAERIGWATVNKETGGGKKSK